MDKIACAVMLKEPSLCSMSRISFQEVMGLFEKKSLITNNTEIHYVVHSCSFFSTKFNHKSLLFILFQLF
jgi:hypothetical protein